jgi:regulator of protease activity HflC (stomatin/prohibitin superfamily)
LNVLFEFLLSIITEFIPGRRIEPWQEGVRVTALPIPFLRKARYKKILPGWRWRLPFFATIYFTNVKRQTTKVLEQRIATADGVTKVVRSVITYAIADVVKVFVEVQDWDDAIMERTETFVAEFVNSKPDAEVTVESIVHAVQPRVKREARRWGLEVEAYGVSELAEMTLAMFYGMKQGGWQHEIAETITVNGMETE